MTLNFSGNSINLTESEAIALQSVLAKMLAAGKGNNLDAPIAKKPRKRKPTMQELIDEFSPLIGRHLSKPQRS